MWMKKLDDHKQKIGASVYELWMMDDVWMDDVFEAVDKTDDAVTNVQKFQSKL